LFQELERVVQDVAGLLGATPSTVKENAERRVAHIKALEEENRTLRAHLAIGRAGELASAAPDGVVVARVDDLTPSDLRDLAVAVRQQEGVRRVVLAGTTTTGGVSLVAAVRPSEGVAAADLIRDAARAVGGGGGGKGDIATAGGKDPEGLDDALRLAREAANA
jgi:alanyl-tRNA synthetase